MPRYIDAEILAQKMADAHGCWADCLKCEGINCCVKQAIEETPTADVQEVKHGHWIDKGVLENYPKPGVNVYHLLWCSECGALHRARPWCEGGWINANYCPKCGCRQDLGGNEE